MQVFSVSLTKEIKSNAKINYFKKVQRFLTVILLKTLLLKTTKNIALKNINKTKYMCWRFKG
jgi:hypothetical protein